MKHLLRPLIVALLWAALAAPVALASPASALTLTDRRVDVAGALNVKAAMKVGDKLMKLDAASDAPIYMVITATKGSAQGVMLVADTVRALRSPVVGVVTTEVRGAGAAVATFTDRLLIYPSAGLIFTELDYEGVKKPDPKPDPKSSAKPAPKGDEGGPKKPANKPAHKVKEPSKETLLLQRARRAFLDRLYARLATRLHMKPTKLTAAIADGGLLLGAREAVDRRAAYALVERLSFVKLPVRKDEVKVTTTEKRTEVAPTSPLDGDGDGDG